MPSPTHSFARILRIGDQSIDLIPENPEAGFTFQQLAHSKRPVMVERTTSNSYRVRELSEDETVEQRGKLVQAMTKRFVDRGNR